MRRMNGDAPRLGAGVALALLATALLAGRLAEGDLIGDPVIYAAVAKSMLVRGEWATPYLAGQPFFDKPPLAACLVLWRLGAFLFDERVGLAAGAILALTPGFVRFGSTLLLDTALALGSLAGLRSEEHTSELQSLAYLVCRLLLEKKKKNNKTLMHYIKIKKN